MARRGKNTQRRSQAASWSVPMSTQLQTQRIRSYSYCLREWESLNHRWIFKHLFKCAQIRGPRINQVIFVIPYLLTTFSGNLLLLPMVFLLFIPFLIISATGGLDARGGRTVVTVSKDRLQSIDGFNAGSNFSPAFKAENREYVTYNT